MPASITAKVWVLAWVSTPITYAKEFATIVMVTLILSLWVDVTTGVDPGKSLRGRPVISHGHHKWSDKLLIKPSQWTGSAPVPTGPDRSWARHSKPIAEGQTLHESQPNRAPTPTLPANPRSATQRLTDASARLLLHARFATSILLCSATQGISVTHYASRSVLKNRAHGIHRKFE